MRIPHPWIDSRVAAPLADTTLQTDCVLADGATIRIPQSEIRNHSPYSKRISTQTASWSAWASSLRITEATLYPSLRTSNGTSKRITVAGSNVSEFKIDCALDELPSLDRWEKGPEFIVGMIQPCPSVDHLEREFVDIRGGDFPEAPAVLIAVPSAADSSLAPPGKHTL